MSDCTYGDAACAEVDATHVSLSEIQTLNGVDGVVVNLTGSIDDGCEFRACE